MSKGALNRLAAEIFLSSLQSELFSTMLVDDMALGDRLLSNIRQFLKIIGEQGKDLGSNLELCSCAEANPPHVDTGNLSRFPLVRVSLTQSVSTRHMRSLTLFRRRRGNRAIHARQYDFSNQILITGIGHLDACEEPSQVVAYGQHRFCLPMERTENDFILGYFAVTLNRWYCGHGYFQNCPKGQKLAFFFWP
jgi:hypothetical protein